MIVGAYSLDLYCDTRNPAHKLFANYGKNSADFAGYDRADAVRQARRWGWTINWKDRTARCPLCKKYKVNVDDG